MTESFRDLNSRARERAAGLLHDTVQYSGPELLRALAGRLGSTLGSPICYLAELVDAEPGTVRTVGRWIDGQESADLEFLIEGSAVERSIREQCFCRWTDVALKFPEDESIAGTGVHELATVPLVDSNGVTLGVLVLGLDPGMAPEGSWEPAVDAVSIRAGMELARIVSERRQLERERWLRSILESDSGLTLIVNPDGQVQYAGPACEKWTGYRPEELAGRSILRLVHPDDHSVCSILLAELFLRRQNGSAYVCRIQHRDGLCRTFEVEGCALVGDSVGRQVILRGRPVSSNVDRESQSGPLSESLMRFRASTACIAHDLRNWMLPILAHARSAKAELPANHPAQERLDVVLKSVQQAGELAGRILALADPVAGPAAVPPVVSLGRIVDEALSVLTILLPPSVEVRSTLARESSFVRAEATELHQVILNLCLNAAQAIDRDDGRIEISVACDEPGNAGETDAGGRPQVRLIVRDNGRGMDDSTRRRAFEPFYSTKAPEPGTGLGLASVREIVQRRSGDIRVESRPGHGTTIEIALPAAAADIKSPVAVSPLGSVRPPVPAGVRILLVDDDDSLLKLLQKTLTRCGVHVITSRNAVAALEAFTRADVPFDAVLTDLNMPGLSGCELARRLRRLDRRTRIIVASGYCDPKMAEEIRLLGNASMIDKTELITDAETMIFRVLELRNPPGDRRST